MIVRVGIDALVNFPVPHDVSTALTFKELYSNGSEYFKHLGAIFSNFFNYSNNCIVNHVTEKLKKYITNHSSFFHNFSTLFSFTVKTQ